MLEGSIASSIGSDAPQADPQQSVSPGTQDGAGEGSSPPPVSEPKLTSRDISNNIRRAMGRNIPPSSQDVTQISQEAKPEGDGESAKAQEQTQTTTDPAKQPLTVTPDELDRRIQAEVDRREAKRARERQEEERRNRERELRKKDPYAYVEEVESREAEEAARQERETDITTRVNEVLTAYDRIALDPLFDRLPIETQNKIIADIEPGLPGREKAAKLALKEFETVLRAEGEKAAREKLINDPAFVKMVLARYGGQRSEPDVIPASPMSGRSSEGGDMNTFIRGGRRR